MVRSALAAGLALGVAASARLSAQSTATAAAAASDKEKQGEAVKLEAFTVTGSNIKRLDFEKVLPVTVFNKDLIDGRNALTPVELLTALPQVTNVPLNESTSGGANSRGDNANINLRGIGSGSTLVLLNGRRVAPHPVFSPDGSNPNSFSVNVNQLPTQGLERIDVLRDGASSIYGSDAIAGVINYMTRRDFRGTEVRTRLGAPEHGGGESFQGTLTYGADFLKGKLRWLSTFDYLYREPIMFTERDRTKSADHRAQATPYLTAFPTAFDGRSILGVWPRFTIGTASTNNYFRPVNGTPTITTVAPTLTANPEAAVDVNVFQNLGQTRSDRQNWFNALEYDLTDRITAFADLSFYHSNTTLLRQPIPLNAPGSDQPAPMSVDNPYNPYGSRFYSPTGAPNADGTPRLTGTPQRIVLTGVTLIEAGGEDIIVHSGIYRGVAGLRGKLFGDWSWEAAALYTRAYTSDISKNAVRESALQAALMRTDASAFNPFRYTFKVQNGAVVPDQPVRNAQNVLDSFVQVWRHDGFSAIGSGDLRLSGSVLRYWGNTMTLAGGGEWRKEQFSDYRPPYAGTNPPGSGLSLDDNDYVQASPKFNFGGDRTVYSAYLETVIPLTQPKHDLPGLHSLELTASARYENYSDFGTTTKPKFGANWRPVAGVMFRGSYNEGFAAANLPTLYQPAQFTVDSLPGQTDPYRSAAALPTAEVTYVQRNYSSGNKDLLPVESTGKSVGVVVDVPWIKGLSITADYWQIKQENEISIRSASQILNRDSQLLRDYVASQLAAGKTIAQIDLGSGTAAYKGDPNVVRLAPTAEDVALFNAANAGKPAAQQLPVVGRIFSRTAKFENLAVAQTSGIDMSLNYNLPALPIGRLTLATDWSYLIESNQVRTPPGAAQQYIERMNVGGTTRWRGTGTITWRKSQWTGSLSAYYIGAFADSTTTTAALYTSLGEPRYISKQFDSGSYLYRFRVRDVTTFNASLGYRFQREAKHLLRGTNVRLGVVNLADTEPPLVPGAFGYSSSVHGSLFAGRTWTLELSRSF
jgi:outer membrane receptor protein involved in Fe transport